MCCKVVTSERVLSVLLLMFLCCVEGCTRTAVCLYLFSMEKIMGFFLFPFFFVGLKRNVM